jgi:GGDEF domain-containing protein
MQQLGVAAPLENHDADTGLLSARGFERAVDAELSRAARHEIPIALVLMEVPGDDRASDRVIAAAVADTLARAVRAEDRVGRLDRLRFAVLATETENGDALAERLSSHVTKGLRAIIGDGTPPAIAAVDCQFDEMSRQDLLAEAEKRLAVAILAADDVAFPPARAQGGVVQQFPRAS